MQGYMSTIWYAVLSGQAFSIFTGKKAFAKYAIINMQYTGANTISCFKITLTSHFQSSDCSCLQITF